MIALDDQEQRWLSGADGAAMQFAMRLVLAAAEVSGATRFVPIEMAHINSCHYSGPLSLDFAEFLLAEGATLAVPTHTNASLIACGTPELRPASMSPEAVEGAARVMDIYESLGCTPMWTCAPYHQLDGRPEFGQQIVGSESNAVGFFNSVLGARTNKYGDVLDVSAALVGRVPYAGLHTDEGRRGTHLFDVSELDDATRGDANLPHLLGAFIGRCVDTGIAVVTGVESASEDELKAVAAAAAATGGVDLFHIVGVTPEAPTVDDAMHGMPPESRHVVTRADLRQMERMLTTASGDEALRAVCLGTPHFSIGEFEETARLLGDRSVDPSVRLIITTSRAVAAELRLRGLDRILDAAGADVVTDTCTYYPPRAAGVDGLTMTNSAKWSYYAQGMLEVPVVFASLGRCIESAIAGSVR